MDQNNGNFSVEDIKKLAGSDVGRQLMAMLTENHGDTANAVRRSMASGDTDQARQALSKFLSDPKAQALLRQLEGRNG
jgi:hypothetical protein